MALKKNVLTKVGRDKLTEELKELKEVRRAEIAAKIKEARAQGDLSENAEYDAAKNEQGEIETRISEIEEILKNAEIVSEEVDKGRVYVGSAVKVRFVEDKDEMEFRLVGLNEVNSIENKISGDSPIGKALLGHKVGEVVTVTAPNGSYDLKILKITKA